MRIPGQLVGIVLAALLAPELAAAEESSGDVWRSDLLLGDYEGDWSREVRVWPRGLVAQVIPRGRGTYVVHLLPKFDQRCPPHATVEARVKEGALVFEDGPWSGRIQGARFTAKGRVQGKLAAFELKKVSRPSPRLGVQPPEDAVVLFDGTGFEHWEGIGKGGKPQDVTWKLVDGAMEAAPTLEEHGFATSVRTRRTFQDYHLHVEFRLPLFPEIIGQSRGNSGIIFENYAFHELQVLDSYGLPGYYDECGAIYTIAAPRVNMCRPPLEWQSYDIIYTGPRCDDEGNLLQAPRITVNHNGKLIHNDLELQESSAAALQRREKPESCEVGRIKLQNHGDPVQYPNIWLEELTMEQLADIRRQGVPHYLRSGHGRGE
jgi:hypothetical protein